MEILLAIVALSFLIIVHEFGHFIVAKVSGIKVHEFALFMGPKLLSMKFGETTYSIRAVPLGGFVRMEGEEEASTDARAFNRKPILVRAAVIAAGPIANLLIAIIIISVVISITGFTTTKIAKVHENSPVLKTDIREGDKIIGYVNKKVYHPMDLEVLAYPIKNDSVNIEVLRGNEKIVRTISPQRYSYKLGFKAKVLDNIGSNMVEDVTPGFPAEKAGLHAGDRIIKLNGTAVANRNEISDYLFKNGENPVHITVLRDNVQKELTPVTAKLEKNPELISLGIDFESGHGNIGETLKQASIYSYSMSRSIYYSLVWLVSGKVPANQMMGPVGIVSAIGETVQQSPSLMEKSLGLFHFIAIISINLGLFNLIPFPALDGSKLIILAIEGVRRKAIPPEKEAIISMVGFAFLIMLMIFTTSNDIMRIFTSVK